MAFTLNPIKAWSRWRSRKMERRDAELRHQALLYSLKTWGGLSLGRDVKFHLCWAHVFYLYIKHGVAEDGMSVDELLKRDDLGVKPLLPPGYFPDGPIKV